MSTNRRKFLKVGTLAALAAAIPFKASGQGIRKGNDGNPIDNNPPEIAKDALANYDKTAFASYLNSVFRLYTGYSTIDVTLVEVKDLMPAGTVPRDGSQCFSLLFRGGNVALPQSTYRVEHPSLGSFFLFLVPGSPDDNGAQSFVAIINRLPYSVSLANAPSRLSKPTGTVTPQPTSAPAKTNTPAPATTPTKKDSPARKPVGDDDFFEGVINW